jgi:restriction system protein
MKLRMAKNSLFAILLRSPWWLSFAIAAGVFAVARLFIPAVYALFIPVPFAVIGCIAAWRQLRAPGAARIAAVVESAQSLSWPEFADMLEEALRRDGGSVMRLSERGADFEVAKGSRRSVVSARRWKVARTGIEPLRELYAVKEQREAQECIYVAAGEVSANARVFAGEKGIRIAEGADLVRLLPALGRSRASGAGRTRAT